MDLMKILSGLNQGAKIVSEMNDSGGKVTPELVLSILFDRRLSSQESYMESFAGHIQKSRKDLPALANRKEFHFYSGQTRLKGYFYPVKNPKAVVVCCHGLAGMADDNFSLCIDYFVRRGYAAIALDLTASGESGGLGVSGLQQGPLDINALEREIHANSEWRKLPLVLFGHSWGGYSVVASTYFDQSPVAICELSGFSTPVDVMMSFPSEKIGVVAEYTRPSMEKALAERAGEYYDLSAVEAIERANNVDFLLIHGSLDKTVSVRSASLWRCFEGATSGHVRTYLDLGKHHADIWLTHRAIEANEELRKLAAPILKKYGKAPKRWPKDVFDSFFANLDKEAINEFDEGLFDQIDSFFERAIKNHENE
ncbi:MAG: alpha/beta hydrolase [Bacilli bacterium]|nr:alpha/beta hydrolase [Bacilli bacterium]